jgi:hypothetical protein
MGGWTRLCVWGEGGDLSSCCEEACPGAYQRHTRVPWLEDYKVGGVWGGWTGLYCERHILRHTASAL